MNPSTAPGVFFEAVPRRAEPSPLRSDVAGFVGRTLRGPVGHAERVEEWREFVVLYGERFEDADTPFAVHAYFENGGRIAHVVRTAGSGTKVATGIWPDPTDPGAPHLPGKLSFLWGDPPDASIGSFLVTASSPGAWAQNATVTIRYRLHGVSGPEIDLEVRAGEERERLRNLPAANALELCEAVRRSSRLVRLAAVESSAHALEMLPGPARLYWEVRLTGASEPAPGRVEYLSALDTLGREREVALVAFPDLHREAGGAAEEIWRTAAEQAESLQDRLVLVDPPPGAACATSVRKVADLLRSTLSPAESLHRQLALYHPWLHVPHPLPGSTDLLRLVPASGPVAGLISRLDRERGAHHTPANAPLHGVVDADSTYTTAERGLLNEEGINLVTCFPGRGLKVWGGRTLDRNLEGRFVAHRRLVHRLVRAIRRVAEPLVFDVNGPEMWLTFVRAVTSVLLEAWRAGALKGANRDQAFRVKCDEETNPPEERDLGRVLCEIQVAPAVPMEFITLRVALGREGELEVFEP